MKLAVKFSETQNVFKAPFSENFIIIHREDNTKSYILIDEDGNEYPAVLVSEETVFTATEDDIREGKVAATSAGVTVGTKVIPSYHTTEGYVIVPPNSVFSIRSLIGLNLYDYTKLQAIICPWAGNQEQSVSAEKVAIDSNVYNVNSTEKLSSVLKNHTNKTIDLGIVNESDKLYLLRYFTYKEVN